MCFQVADVGSKDVNKDVGKDIVSNSNHAVKKPSIRESSSRWLNFIQFTFINY